MMGDLTYEYGIDHAIIVADKGMMTGNNVARIRAERNGYVISYSVRGASKTFQQYVLDEAGYTYWGADAKYKSRIYARTIEFTNHAGRQEKITINERQIVFYSSKYAEKAKRDRAKAVEKARAMAAHPAMRAKAQMKGAAKYLQTIQYDKEGEVISGLQDAVVFDEQKLAEEELLDGYYVIMTNVIGIDEHTKPFRGKNRYLADGFFQLNRPVSDTDIIEMYKGLWKIEESFKVTKSDLRTRPVYLSREDHIEAHFLVCFTALTILRILEHQLQGTYGAAQIADSLKKANGTFLENGYYVFDYYDQVLKDLGEVLNLDFSRKYRTKAEIRSMLGSTKKAD
jgi:transposase